MTIPLATRVDWQLAIRAVFAPRYPDYGILGDWLEERRLWGDTVGRYALTSAQIFQNR